MINKKLVVLIIAIVSVGIISWFVYDFLFLRVVSTTPHKNQIATTTPYIRVLFNHDIASVGKTSLSDFETTSSIEGKSIKIDIPENSLYKGNTYSLNLSDIVSKDGKKISSYSFSFIVKYVSPNKQPEEIQKALVDKSDSGQTNDPFLLLPFPMGTTEDIPFYLSATVDPVFERPFIEVTFIEEIRNPSISKKPQVSNERAEQLYTEVMQYIKAKGGTPENYDFYFSNSYLNEKYTVSGG